MVALLAVGALFAAACSEPEPDAAAPVEADAPGEDATVDPPDADAGAHEETGDSATGDDATGDNEAGDTATEGDGTSIVERLAGQEWFLGTMPDLPVAADPALEPIRIGMINQENTGAGSYPELRHAAEAAINFVNAELGGVDGRPLELVPCITDFSVESSQACAQELVLEEVVALVGGIDVLVQGALPVLEQNGLPIVGGIPAGLAEQQSPSSYAFSGGTAGGMAAFMAHAADQGYERAFIAYGEFESFQVAAEDYGARVGRHLGLDVRLHAFPLFGADYTSVLNDAKAFDAQAVVINAADAACVPVMEGFRDFGFDGTLYLFGACAADEIIESAGGADEGVVFNGEGPPDPDAVDGTVFDLASTEYNTGNAQAAGTVAFRGMMNLYAVLLDLGADGITSEAIVEELDGAVDRNSFWGHPYTCDGAQVPGLPSLCAPQQALFTFDENATLTFVSDWIDTVALFEDAFAE